MKPEQIRIINLAAAKLGLMTAWTYDVSVTISEAGGDEWAAGSYDEAMAYLCGRQHERSAYLATQSLQAHRR